MTNPKNGFESTIRVALVPGNWGLTPKATPGPLLPRGKGALVPPPLSAARRGAVKVPGAESQATTNVT